MQNINWDDIRYFLAVYRERTLSGAAESLEVNHTTVSRRITALEQKLKIKLFVKKRKGMCLTEQAHSVLNFAMNMESEAHAFSRKLQGQDSQLSGKLRITLADSFMYYFMGRSLVDFSELYPDIELEILNSDNPVNLNTQEADIAFRFTDNPPEHLIGRRVAMVDYAIYASKELYESTNDFNQSKIKALCWNYQITRPLWLEKNFSNVQIGTRFDSVMGLMAFLRNGAGIAQLPCIFAENDPLLKRIPTQFVEPGWGVWILYHLDLKSSSKVRTAYQYFSKYLIKEMKNYQLSKLSNVKPSAMEAEHTED